MEDITTQEKSRRKALYQRVRTMAVHALPIDDTADTDETSLMTNYRGFYLQIAFSQAHPLMVFYLAKQLEGPYNDHTKKLINDLNLRSVLGCHALNDEVGCYSYRAAHWLDAELSKERFLEILTRCSDDALRAYEQVSRIQTPG